jgi:hypothetical protein
MATKKTAQIEMPLKFLRKNINGYGGDWPHVFECASKPVSLDGVASEEIFIIDEVQKVIASVNGYNDGPSWLMIGRLKDKRYFFISAGCDYTGWDCHAFGHSVVSMKIKTLLKSITTDDYVRLFS